MALTGDVVCRGGYGQARWLAKLPGANDALRIVMLQPAGQQDDQVLRDHEYLGTLLAAGNREATTPGYSRVTVVSGMSEVVDNTNNRVDSDIPDLVIPKFGAMSGTGSRQEISAFLVCWVPDIAAAADASTLVLTKHYYPMIADGRDALVPFPNGFFRAAGA